jgi:hypothetical protein
MIHHLVKQSILIVTAFLLCFCGVLSCQSVENRLMNSKTEIKDFNWLIGNWKRTNNSEGEQTYENWTKKSEEEYHGHGFTMADLDTLWQESMILIYEEYNWHLKITSIEHKISTVFKLNQTDSISFTCINLDNEFPTHIKYSRNGDSLIANIWADSIEVPFEFIKTN